MSGESSHDRGRTRVYDAEKLVRGMFDRADASPGRQVTLHGSTITLPVERRFASIASVEDYLRQVLALDAVRGAFDRAGAPIRVRPRAGSAAAHYEYPTATIAVPTDRGGRWALRELVILHELAHHLDAPDSVLPAHGIDFVHRYLELVDIVIGPEAALVLRSAYSGTGALP